MPVTPCRHRFFEVVAPTGLGSCHQQKDHRAADDPEGKNRQQHEIPDLGGGALEIGPSPRKSPYPETQYLPETLPLCLLGKGHTEIRAGQSRGQEQCFLEEGKGTVGISLLEGPEPLIGEGTSHTVLGLESLPLEGQDQFLKQAIGFLEFVLKASGMELEPSVPKFPSGRIGRMKKNRLQEFPIPDGSWVRALFLDGNDFEVFLGRLDCPNTGRKSQEGEEGQTCNGTREGRKAVSLRKEVPSLRTASEDRKEPLPDASFRLDRGFHGFSRGGSPESRW